MYPVAGNDAPGPYRPKRYRRRSGCQVLTAIIAGSVAAGFLLCLVLAGTGVIFGNTGAHPDVSVRNQLGVDQKINDVWKDYLDELYNFHIASSSFSYDDITGVEVPTRLYTVGYGEENLFREIYNKHKPRLENVLNQFSLEKGTISAYDYATIKEEISTDDFFNVWPKLGDSVPANCLAFNEVYTTYTAFNEAVAYGPLYGAMLPFLPFLPESIVYGPPTSFAFPLNNDSAYERIVGHVEYSTKLFRAAISGKMLEKTHSFLSENGLKLDLAEYIEPYESAFGFLSLIGPGCANRDSSTLVSLNQLLGQVVYGYDTVSSPVFTDYCAALEDLAAASNEFIDYFESVPYDSTVINVPFSSVEFFLANNLRVCDEAHVFGGLLADKVDIYVDRMIEDVKYYKAFVDDTYSALLPDYQGFDKLWTHVYVPELFGVTDIGWNNVDDCDDPYGEPGIASTEAYFDALRFMEQFYNIAPHSGVTYNYIGNFFGGCNGGGNAFVIQAVRILPEYRSPGAINIGPIGSVPKGIEYTIMAHELVHAQQTYGPEPRKCPSCHIRKGSYAKLRGLSPFSDPRLSFVEGGANFIESLARDTLFRSDQGNQEKAASMAFWLYSSSRLFDTAQIATRIGKFTTAEAAMFLRNYDWSFDIFFGSLENAEEYIKGRVQRDIGGGFTVYTAGYLRFNDTYIRMQDECTLGIPGGKPEKAFGDAMSSFGKFPTVDACMAALDDFIDRGCTEFDYIL